MTNYQYGIAGLEAPDWNVSEWLNLPEGQTALERTDFAGKVVYLYGFQSWCPGCHSHGFPTLKAVQGQFKDDPNVAFVAIQTVFEGFETNTLAAARETADKHNLSIPFGHDAPNGQRSPVMMNYRAGGTPWTVIIDQEGVVRFNDFHANATDIINLINTLKI